MDLLFNMYVLLLRKLVPMRCSLNKNNWKFYTQASKKYLYFQVVSNSRRLIRSEFAVVLLSVIVILDARVVLMFLD